MTLTVLALSALFALAVDSPTTASPGSVVEEIAASSTEATKPTAGSETAARRAAPRDAMTLDEITIEGDVDVPQVLFITARDHLRVAGSQHTLYWTDALATVLQLPAIGPLRPPVDDSATTAPAPQREN